MKIIDRYIISAILNTTLVMLLVFTTLLLVINLFGQRSDLYAGTYGFAQALVYVILNLPLSLYSLFPNVALLSALLGLGSLASYSELTVIRASGMSTMRIGLSVVFAAIIIIGIATAVGELIAPQLSAYAQANKAYETNNGQIFISESSVWLHRNNAFIHIGNSINGTSLQDITVYQFNAQHELIMQTHADSADYISGSQWKVKNIVESNILPQQVTAQATPSAIWEMNIEPPSLGMIAPFQMTINQLNEQVHYRKINGLNPNQFLLTIWQRIFQPFTTLMMILLAIPFVFGPLRSATAGFRLLCGLMIGLSLFVFNRFFGPFSLVYQLPPILSAAIPAIIFAFTGFFMLLKKR